jgi:predicted DNA-binding transcriptional regulator AlpA
MTIEVEDRLFTVPQAAQYTGMSESFIIAHARRPNVTPRITCIKIGNKIRFRRSSLDTFISGCAERTKKVE